MSGSSTFSRCARKRVSSAPSSARGFPPGVSRAISVEPVIAVRLQPGGRDHDVRRHRQPHLHAALGINAFEGPRRDADNGERGLVDVDACARRTDVSSLNRVVQKRWLRTATRRPPDRPSSPGTKRRPAAGAMPSMPKKSSVTVSTVTRSFESGSRPNARRRGVPFATMCAEEPAASRSSRYKVYDTLDSRPSDRAGLARRTCDDFFRMADWDGAPERGMHQREYGDVGADAEHERPDDREGEEWRVAQAAHGVAQIPREIGDQADAACVATCIGDARHSAEGHGRSAAGLRLIEPRARKLGSLAVQVKLQLVVEIGIGPCREDERADPKPQIAQHGGPPTSDLINRVIRVIRGTSPYRARRPRRRSACANPRWRRPVAAAPTRSVRSTSRGGWRRSFASAA